MDPCGAGSIAMASVKVSTSKLDTLFGLATAAKDSPSARMALGDAAALVLDVLADLGARELGARVDKDAVVHRETYPGSQTTDDPAGRMSTGGGSFAPIDAWTARSPDGRVEINLLMPDPEPVKRAVAWMHDRSPGRALHDGFAGSWEACERDGWSVIQVSLHPAAVASPEDVPAGGSP